MKRGMLADAIDGQRDLLAEGAEELRRALLASDEGAPVEIAENYRNIGCLARRVALISDTLAVLTLTTETVRYCPNCGEDLFQYAAEVTRAPGF